MGRLNQKGSVLILSLWVLIFLSLVAASLAYRAQIELRLSRYPGEEVRLRQSAKETVEKCCESWRKSPSVFKDEACGIEDESARINLNQASPEVLNRLFGPDAAIVPGIIDWRLPGPGRWDSAYSGSDYAPRHGPFKSLEELMLVKGMTPEIFQDVSKELTVNTDGGVNINTASSRALDALGLKPALVHKVLASRIGGDFTTLESVLPLLKEKTFLSEDDVRSLAVLLQRNALCVQSDRLCLHILARLPNSRMARRFVVIAAARSNPVRILSWREVF